MSAPTSYRSWSKPGMRSLTSPVTAERKGWTLLSVPQKVEGEMEYSAQSLVHGIRLLIVAGIIAYVGFAALLVVFQSRMIYLPISEIQMTPDSIGLAFEDVTFETDDEIQVTGWFIPAESAEKTVLFCHGNGGNISHRIDTIRIFHELGLNTFIFDYRGYGRSTGKPTEKGTYRDADTAWHYLVDSRGVLPGNIIVFGRSLGGSLAAWVTANHSPCAVILESSFISIPELGARLYPWLPVRMLSRFKYATIPCLKEIRCPVLVVHSREDELVPFSHGQTIFEAAQEPKKFLVIEGTHNDGFLLSERSYKEGLMTFLAQYTTP